MWRCPSCCSRCGGRTQKERARGGGCRSTHTCAAAQAAAHVCALQGACPQVGACAQVERVLSCGGLAAVRCVLLCSLPLCVSVCALQVPDEEAARFIASCVGEPEQRHTASQLLEDPFLQVTLSVCLQQHRQQQQQPRGIHWSWPVCGCASSMTHSPPEHTRVSIGVPAACPAPPVPADACASSHPCCAVAAVPAAPVTTAAAPCPQPPLVVAPR